jgi:hypothetical protein
VQGLATSGALATEAGAKQYAALMALAPAYKQVSDYMAQLEEQSKAAAQALAEQAEAARQQAAEALRSTVNSAFSALQSAVEAKKGAVQKSFENVFQTLDGRIAMGNNRGAEVRGFRESLREAASSMGVGPSRQDAQAQIATAVAIARASGRVPDMTGLQDALRALREDASDQFATAVDAQRDQLRTANQIEELGNLTDAALSVEEQMLGAIIAQRAAAETALALEVQRLDALAATAQAQVAAINGTTMAVLDLQTALQQYTGAVSAALANPIINTQARMAQSSIYTAQQSSTMTQDGSAIVAELQNMNSRLSGVESAMNTTASSTSQFAQEFNRVSAGGNALLTEPA